MINKIKAEIERWKIGKQNNYTKGYIYALEDSLKWAEELEKELKKSSFLLSKRKRRKYFEEGEVDDILLYWENVEKAFHGEDLK